MIKIHLYGRLRRHAPSSKASAESILQMQPRPDETAATVLERAGILPADVYHIFLNGAILSTRNSLAPWLQYEQVERRSGKWSTVRASGMDTELDVRVHDGDRLGLFADDMGLLVV